MTVLPDPLPPPSAEVLVSLRKAAFGYRGTPVIRQVSFHISRGQFIGLVGPNGAGKSTLFRGILRLLPALEGSVHHAPALRRRIGYVPQRDQLDAIFPLSAFAVARMGATGILPWYQRPTADLDRRVEASLARVGMQAYRGAAFAELSGGQRQRVLIARALAMEPQLLVLDEPTAGIDAAAEQSILALLSDLNRAQGITILMVSHNLQSLRSHVHQVILIKDHGIQIGSAEEMLRPEKIMENLSASL
jgi:ABC-type Mn2+/Zn2+ transport system ATPase subunit